MGLIKGLKGVHPAVHPTAFIAETAQLIGDVRVGEQSSIWYGSVLRADVMPIIIGKRVNVQDLSCLHGTYQKAGVVLEDDVTIGHSVVLHGCHIGEGSLVGMGSIVMDGARVGKNCLVGAGSLLTEGADLSKEGWLCYGRPCKAVRPLKEKELQFLKQSPQNYIKYSNWYLSDTTETDNKVES